jgi:hypothetical protein
MELEDQKWFPDTFRQGITDYLQYASNRVNLYQKIVPVLKKGLEKSQINRIVDLCSGGGGGMQSIYQNLQRNGIKTEIVLTDKFPNLEAFRAASKKTKGNIRFISEPVDATCVPADLTGFRTQFVSFHHFKPDFAKKILADAAEKQVPLGIFEVTGRNWRNFAAMLFTPLVVMLATPFIQPFSWKKLFWTYVIPVIPFSTMWDGLVSVFRTYNEAELLAMTSDLNKDGYTWETGEIDAGKGIKVLYLLGYPAPTAKTSTEEYRQAA